MKPNSTWYAINSQRITQNAAILYTISRQIAISTNIENAKRVRPLSEQI